MASTTSSTGDRAATLGELRASGYTPKSIREEMRENLIAIVGSGGALFPGSHGYETAEMMHKWVIDGAEPPKITYTDGILITRETYEKIMKEQGLL